MYVPKAWLNLLRLPDSTAPSGAGKIPSTVLSHSYHCGLLSYAAPQLERREPGAHVRIREREQASGNRPSKISPFCPVVSEWFFNFASVAQLVEQLTLNFKNGIC